MNELKVQKCALYERKLQAAFESSSHYQFTASTSSMSKHSLNSILLSATQVQRFHQLYYQVINDVTTDNNTAGAFCVINHMQ